MDLVRMSEELSVSLDSPLQPLTSSLDICKGDAELAAALLDARAPLARYYALRAASDHCLTGPSPRAELPIVEAELRSKVAAVVLSCVIELGSLDKEMARLVEQHYFWAEEGYAFGRMEDGLRELTPYREIPAIKPKVSIPFVQQELDLCRVTSLSAGVYLMGR